MFVKLVRSQTSFTFVLECLHRYQREISSFHRVSLTRVTVREFWVRSPNRTWQFFLILHDSILEIRANRMYIPRESIHARTVDISGTSADETNDPFFPFEDRK